jgi:type I restriction enzyme S subunit
MGADPRVVVRSSLDPGLDFWLPLPGQKASGVERMRWGAGVIPRLARDIANDMPEVKGFSERNIGYMIRFACEYGARPILQQPVAKLPAGGSPSIVPQAAAQLANSDDLTILQQLAAKLPWFHHVIRDIHIALPPLPEQREIVRRVEELFTFADQLEARFAKAQAHVDKLTQSLLGKAFRGELVPQDPNDEPAAALLARIRGNGTSPKPGRKRAGVATRMSP